MSERDHKYDIQIADDEWIEYVNIDGRYADAIDLDGHLTGLWPLIDRLETHCVAGCCGFDAYDFTREGINAALPGLDHGQLQAACDQAKSGIATAGSDVFMSTRMNNYAHKAMLLRLLEHLESCIANHPPAHE
ncbi:DUF6331 family protein [Janthinobacterium sp. HLX7-2]|uniref:DUF6331 family protein n=1 Tax=Janthinobacterium sp. HLX7-2 TaxID=1259331 RepID=UPI003F22260B